MERTLRTLSVCVVLAAISYSAAKVTAAEIVQAQEQELELAPRSNEEPCIKLKRNDLLEISFSASAEVDFNIHYHLESQVRFPVNLKQQREYKYSYVAPAAREYCLMWTNKNALPLRLSYRYQVQR
ncbi:hypothetical protein EYC98_13610 [Halieaceae bacterium IMCC14734]|uniref:Uncharacterized protein n=1 Tax=Candidatus Litorirhabdus singularis TaxID=2518993 RepID=A0ABT3THZ9_9GAMM|nr:hypothetical protein [Candidatus Litorirhabdus singularis]MCX2981894.1 hypothetical protein [Candidatus Litorirhabdus singularis]